MITGKALIIVERVDYKYRGYAIEVHVKTCSSENCDAHEDIICCAEANPPCTNLKIGERAWVWVVYEISYHSSYDHYYGVEEWDVDVDYRKIRVLKRSKPGGRHYQSSKSS